MGKSIVFLAFILFSAQMHGYEKRVSSKAVKIIATTTLVIDGIQTLNINNNPDIKEDNPVLNYFMEQGEAQGALATVAYFGSIIYLINELPPKYDPLVNALSAFEISFIHKNISIGVDIKLNM